MLNKLNSLPSFYWKNLCKIKSFNLANKSHRILTVAFWIVFAFTLTFLTTLSISFSKEISTHNKDKDILDQFEATFALNRFLEKLSRDVSELNTHLTSTNQNNGPISIFFTEQNIPAGFTLDDINNIINKLSNQIIFKEYNTHYDERELKLFDSIANKLGYINYAHRPSVGFIGNTVLLINFSGFLNQSLVKDSLNHRFFDPTDLSNQIQFVNEEIFNLAKASLSRFDNNEPERCCLMSYLNSEKTAFNEIIDIEHLPIEASLKISNALPYEYSIDSFDKQYINNSNYYGTGTKYYPAFLTDAFCKLSFYDPWGFNPLTLKDNILRARQRIGSSSEITERFLYSILITLGFNIIFIAAIRIIGWVNHG